MVVVVVVVVLAALFAVAGPLMERAVMEVLVAVGVGDDEGDEDEVGEVEDEPLLRWCRRW